MRAAVLAIGIAASALATADAAETPRLTIASTAAVVRAARDAHTGRVWRLSFVKTVARPGSEPQRRVSVVEVDLSSDYLRVTEGGVSHILDFELRRSIALDPPHKTFLDDSLIALVALRGAEAVARNKAAKSDPSASGKAFWIASDLGISVSTSDRVGLTQSAAGERTVAFSFNGEEVVRATFSDTPVPPDRLRMWERFLRYRTHLHPLVVSALVRSGLLLQRLDYQHVTAVGREHITLALRGAQWAAADYPLPADFSPSYDGLAGPGAATLKRMLPRMIEAVASSARGSPSTPAGAEQRILRALDERRTFDAALLALDAEKMFPEAAHACDPAARSGSFCDAINKGKAVARADGNYALYAAAMAYAHRRQFGRSLRLLRRLPAEAEAGYVVSRAIAEDLIATLAAEPAGDPKKSTGVRTEIEARLVSALYGNPYFRNVYREIGNYYVAIMRHDLAWIVFDLGRAVGPAHEGDLLRPVTVLENRLVARYPELF